LDDELPYRSHSKNVKTGYLFDNDSVPLHVYNEKQSYHPVYIFQFGLHLLDVFLSKKDSSLLTQIKAIAKKMEAIAVEVDSSLFFSYSFDFPLHGFNDQILYSPWYSGMSQGQGLSYYCRLYKLTGDSIYLNAASKVFNSFLRLKGNNNLPWVSCVDSKNNIWLEEYPMDLPAFTLNGMVFAIYGIYDYYLVTSNPQASLLLRGSITTIKKNIHLYENTEDISFYCLKHKVKNLGYHNIHVGQLKMLYKITGDNYFKEISEKFYADTELINNTKKVNK
jgi:hypothetical protein